MEKKPDNRARCVATIVYPESAPSDWREKLSALHIQALVSPLHDRDTYVGAENQKKYKKEHFHVLMYFEGKQSESSLQEIIDSIGGVGLERIKSKSGYARYLIHADDPDKAQYSATDVRCFGGADFYEWSKLDTDPMLYIGDIMDFIDRHDVMSFYQLALYCRKYKPEWHKILATRNTIFFKEFLKSRNWEGSKPHLAKNIVDDWQKQENS